jgi:hypothetical protein
MVELFFFGSPVKFKKLLRTPRTTSANTRQEHENDRFENAVHQEVAKTRREHNNAPNQQERRLRGSQVTFFLTVLFRKKIEKNKDDLQSEHNVSQFRYQYTISLS